MRSRENNAASGPTALPWRRAFRRHLTALLLVKLVALGVLWALFFSPAHRSAVDRGTVERRLAAGRPQPAARLVAGPSLTDAGRQP